MTEDLSGIFKPEAKTVIKIFGDADSYYQIPDYQRAYSWDDEQIEQFWDDIYAAMQSEDESYFLGPIILVRTRDGYFEVVDGQQRLTTLTILFCVLRDLYMKDDNKILNAIKSLVDQKYRLRLITQVYHQNEFEQEVLNSVKFPSDERAKKHRTESKFINAALIFREKLRAIADKSGQIDALVEYLLNRVIMITITCANQSFAIKLFQVLNTRGLDLSHADLLKSYLYGECKESKKGQFISTWTELEHISKHIGESLGDLLTYYEYHLLARNPKQSLYEELINQFKGQDPNAVIYRIKQFVESFREVLNIDSKIVYSFRYLPNQVFWKAILATAKSVAYNEFDELCKELRKMYYAYWIAGYTTSKIKQLSFNLITWVKEKKDMPAIKGDIGRKMAEDTVIKRITEILQDNVYGKSWLKPLLTLIEYEQMDDSKLLPIELDSRLHVDHILPEGWSSSLGWDSWTKTQAEKWLHKIGNLTLLSGKKNMAMHNDPPSKKIEMYEKGHGGTTAFEISKKVIEIFKKSGWSEIDVTRRHKWVIEQTEAVLGLELKLEYGPESATQALPVGN